MMAQRTIKGKVSDSAGELPGASVMIQGTTTGVATDMDGNYSISVNNGDVLEVSFMGYTNKVIKITSKTPSTLNISMEEDSKMMDEVVVEVGYGQMRKSDLTGSLSSVSEDQVKAMSTVSVDQALSGRVSGVQVSASSGQPGAESNVRIRGTSTLTGNSSPLYVVDGMPIGGGKQASGSNPLASINPADIVSMEVLKDASATAIYGSRAANGVIMITTKKGSESQAKVSYAGTFSVSTVSDKLDMMDLQDYAKFYTSSDVLSAFKISDADKELVAAAQLGGKGTDWQDEIFRTALSHSHQVSVNGGNKETQFAFSLGYQDQNGVIINTDFQRFNGRLNIDNQTKKWLKTGMNLAYTHITQTKQEGFELSDDNSLGGIGVGGATDEKIYVQSLISKPSTAPTDFDGNFTELGGEDQEIKTNPVRDANYSPIYVTRNNVIGGVYANIQFMKDLNWRNDFGVDYTSAEEHQFTPSLNGSDNSQEFIERENMYWRFSSTLNYNTKFGAKHRFGAMLGYEVWKATWSGIDGTKSSYLDDLLFTDKEYQNMNLGQTQDITGYKGAQAMMSFLARLNYNYDERYLITATGRFDGSSTLAPDNRWGFFPSFAFAWRADQESFIKDNDNVKKVISSFKVRAGYGQTGNAGSNMGYITYYSQVKGQNSNGLSQGTWLNSDLIWETNWQVNGGIDISFLRNNRISLTFDAFYKRNNDLIIQAEPGSSLASTADSWLYTTVPDINAGSMQNAGFDITLTTLNIRKHLGEHDFDWTTDVNFSLVRNKVLELQTDSTSLDGNGYFKSSTRTYCKSVVDKAPGLFYGYKTDGIIQNSNQLAEYSRFDGTDVGDINYVDINSDGRLDDNDKTFIGDPNPDFTFGMNNTLSWGPWSFNIFISGSYGNDVYNLLRSKLEGMDRSGVNQLTTVLDYARVRTNEDGTKYVENSNTNMPRPNSSASGGDDANTVSDRYIEDGSFLRIQNIGLSYQLPKRYTEKMHLSNMKVSFNVQNVATFTGYSGMNPEVSNSSAIFQGVDLGGYPLPRMFVFGLNFDF